MKKFIQQTSFYVLPFFVLYLLNVLFYQQNEGDLIRIGYLYSNPSAKSKIIDQYDLPKRYNLLSEIDLTTKNKFKVVTIGDSFSEQDNLGYQNFLANMDVSLLHIDRIVSGENPHQSLVQLLNSDFFNQVETEYIVLQSVERHFNERNENLDFNKSTDLDSVSNKTENYTKNLPEYNLRLFSKATLKVPFTNIEYLFKPKPINSKTYKYKSTSNSLFSNNPDELLFYKDDISLLDQKNDSSKITNSIKALEAINKLAAKRDIKLIVLVSPDKYDLYYQYIKNNTALPQPLFFSIYEDADKSYENIDSYQLLSEKIKREKNLYFYDDTHWSPKAAKIIAELIYNTIYK
jgi:hypothetical protein